MRKAKVIFSFSVVLISLFLFSCPKESDAQPEGNPKDFFPTKVGTIWTYKIKLGKARPLRYEVVLWPQGKSVISMATRGFFAGSFEEDKQEFILKMRVKSLAPKQGKLEYPIGVELEIETDELGIFEYHKQVFFAATSSGGFIAHQVVTRDYSSPGAPHGSSWGSWGGEDGYSMPIIFFAEKPGTQLSMGENSPDTLLFMGISELPANNLNGLHFLRTVKPQEEKVGEELTDLEKGFTEDIWYVRGKGLAHLVQKVEGKVSMTWTLTSFSQ